MEITNAFTVWQLQAPLEQVWDAIYNSLEWPQWWKGVRLVKEIEKEDVNGINSVKIYTWQSVLPYQFTFTMRLTGKEQLKHLKGIAFGELEGSGEWFFSEHNGVTSITYYWNIFTNKRYMNIFSFLLKPALIYNHNRIMHWGAIGLAKKLDATLIKG